MSIMYLYFSTGLIIGTIAYNIYKLFEGWKAIRIVNL